MHGTIARTRLRTRPRTPAPALTPPTIREVCLVGIGVGSPSPGRKYVHRPLERREAELGAASASIAPSLPIRGDVAG